MTKLGPLLVLLALLAGCGDDSSARMAAVLSAPDPDRVTRPVGLDIPSIGLHVDRLGSTQTDAKGHSECPLDPQTVTWNSDGTPPGDKGLAMIVASQRGVFARLTDLGGSAPIVVNRSDGTHVTFHRLDTGRPATTPRQLQLIACGGSAPVTVYAALAG